MTSPLSLKDFLNEMFPNRSAISDPVAVMSEGNFSIQFYVSPANLIYNNLHGNDEASFSIKAGRGSEIEINVNVIDKIVKQSNYYILKFNIPIPDLKMTKLK